ncbi:hypothetical protein [Streptomyces sp. NPDC056296]
MSFLEFAEAELKDMTSKLQPEPWELGPAAGQMNARTAQQNVSQ